MTSWQITGFLLCVALATCAQNLTGFAMALILLGLTGLFDLAPLPDMANVATVLSLANAAIVLRGARKSMDWPMLRATAMGSLFGVAAGVLLLGWLNANVVMVLRLLLGIVVIACAIVVLVRARPLARRSSNASLHAFGLLSGLLGGLFSVSGPPLVYQFYRQPMPVDAVRDTLVAALAISSLMRLAMVVPSGQFSALSLMLCLMAAPVAIALSWWLQRHPPRWPRPTVLKLVCALLLVTGAGLVGPALQSLAARLPF
jgi:uncharacterized membrane protein YfcA